MKNMTNRKAPPPNRKILDKSFVEFVIDQIQAVGNISHKYMFGGCAIYRNNKVVALICDNQLYIRPTAAGKMFIKTVVEKPPYRGTKPHFLIEDVDDKEWLCDLIKITDKELSQTKTKRK